MNTTSVKEPSIREEQLFYTLALTMVDGLGPIRIRRLIEICGSAEEVFRQSSDLLKMTRGFSGKCLRNIVQFGSFDRVEAEMRFLEKRSLKYAIYGEPHYPRRMRHCSDAPIILFSHGNCQFNEEKFISIVGTRSITSYGRKFIHSFVEQLEGKGITIVSGLAYGVDIECHRAAIKFDIPTIGVVAHGLDRVYPLDHAREARLMLERGGLATEFTSGTKPDRENFPMRNRIIAGLSDATIVVESKRVGGSMITAEIANTYNRDVFAVPGRITDICSEGCNRLIRNNKAHILRGVEDLDYIMGWEPSKKKVVHKRIFVQLSEEEESFVNCVKDIGEISSEALCEKLKWTHSRVATIALKLELEGVIQVLPGRVYRLN